MMFIGTLLAFSAIAFAIIFALSMVVQRLATRSTNRAFPPALFEAAERWSNPVTPPDEDPLDN